MSTVLQLWDEVNLVPLFDWNDSTGANNPFGVRTWLLGDPSVGGLRNRRSMFTSDTAPGAIVTSKQADLGIFSFRVRGTGTSYDNLAAGYSRMVSLLDLGGVLKWIPDGSVETRFVDFIVPSEILGLLRSQEAGLYKLLKLFDDPDGLPISLDVQPYFRGPELDPSVNKLTNSTLLADDNVDGIPNGWLSVGNPTSPVIDTVTEALVFTVDGAGWGYYKELSASVGQVWTAQVEAAMLTGTRPAQLKLSFRDATNELAVVTALRSEALYGGLAVTSAAAPSGTTLVRIGINSGTTGSGSGTIGFRDPQLALAASVSEFRVGKETVPNDPADPNGRVFLFRNIGDAPAPAKFYIKADAIDLRQVRVAVLSARVTGGRRLAEVINSVKAIQCEDHVSGGVDTFSSVDANASGGDAAQTDYAIDGTGVMNTRVPVDLTTVLQARKGTWDIYVRVRGSGHASSQHRMRLDHYLGGTPATLTGSEVAFTPGTSTLYADIKLARIRIPEDIDPKWFSIELLSKRVSATGQLFWDFIFCVPVIDGIQTVLLPERPMAANEHIYTDPATDRAWMLDSAEKANGLVKADGGIPFWAPAGLSAVFLIFGETGLVDGRYSSLLTRDPTVWVKYAPRYYL